MTLKSDPNFKRQLTFCLKYDMKNLVNLTQAVESLEMFTFMGYFSRKYVIFEFKKYRRSVS